MSVRKLRRLAAVLCLHGALLGACSSGEGGEPAELKLVVQDQSGKAVPRSQVTVWQSGRTEDGASEWSVARETADALCGVKLKGLDATVVYRLEITPPETRQDLALFDEGLWRPAAGSVRLEPGFAASGVVKDPLDRSLSDVSVYALAPVRRSDGSWTTGGGRNVERDGSFRFEHVPLRPLFLRAFRHDEHYTEHDVAVAVATPEKPQVQIMLARDDASAQIVRRVDGLKPGQAAFRVESAWEAAMSPREPPAAILVSGEELSSQQTFVLHVLPRFELGADGTFRIEPTFETLTSGLWIPPESPESNLSLWAPEIGFSAADKPLRLAPGQAIRGRVRGEVPAGAPTRAYVVGPGRIAILGVVQPDRHFEIRGIPVGRWRVTVEVDLADGQRRRGSVEADAGAEVDVEVR